MDLTRAGLGALIFDKDGTLFDFEATWGAWTLGIIDWLAEDDTSRAEALAQRLGYNRAAQAFLPGSIVIAHTPAEIVAEIMDLLPGWQAGALIAEVNARAATAPLKEAAPLVPLLSRLRSAGLKLGVMTNDSEEGARAQLTATGAMTAFDAVFGFDSGYGAKPDPAPLLALCDLFGVPPAACAMIGDSLHDIAAGRAAGMVTIGVLTGPATRADLAGAADIVLPSVADLPGALGL